jgi:ABC-type phosphate transport system substrate-binding protein
MDSKTRKIRAALLTGVLAAASAPAPSGAQGFVFIKNARNGTDQLSRVDVKKLYTGRIKTWRDAGVVTVVLAPEGSPPMVWLSQGIFGVSPRLLITKIKQEVFKGEMARPLSARSDAEAVELVRNTPGAIAVVPDQVAAALPQGVAVLRLGP